MIACVLASFTNEWRDILCDVTWSVWRCASLYAYLTCKWHHVVGMSSVWSVCWEALGGRSSTIKRCSCSKPISNFFFLLSLCFLVRYRTILCFISDWLTVTLQCCSGAVAILLPCGYGTVTVRLRYCYGVATVQVFAGKLYSNPASWTYAFSVQRADMCHTCGRYEQTTCLWLSPSHVMLYEYMSQCMSTSLCTRACMCVHVMMCLCMSWCTRTCRDVGKHVVMYEYMSWCTSTCRDVQVHVMMYEYICMASCIICAWVFLVHQLISEWKRKWECDHGRRA